MMMIKAQPRDDFLSTYTLLIKAPPLLSGLTTLTLHETCPAHTHKSTSMWKSVSAFDPDQQIHDTFIKRQVTSRVVAWIVDTNNYFHFCRCAFCGSRCRVNTSQVLINCILGQWHGKNQYLPWPTTNTSRSVQFMSVSRCLCGGKKAFARTVNKCVHVLCGRVKLDHKSRRENAIINIFVL